MGIRRLGGGDFRKSKEYAEAIESTTEIIGSTTGDLTEDLVIITEDLSVCIDLADDILGGEQ